MAELVSPCCGAEYTDNDDGPSYCCGAKILQGICSDPDCLDHAEPEIGFVCEQCDEFFEVAETDYEYAEQQKESIAEDRMDAERDES